MILLQLKKKPDGRSLSRWHKLATCPFVLSVYDEGEHPGGKKSIMMFAGKDATEEFDMLHDRKVIKKYGLDEGTVVLKGTIKK